MPLSVVSFPIHLPNAFFPNTLTKCQHLPCRAQQRNAMPPMPYIPPKTPRSHKVPNSIRLVNGLPTTIWNTQPRLHIPILIHQTPLRLPLVSLCIENDLPRLVESLKPVIFYQQKQPHSRSIIPPNLPEIARPVRQTLTHPPIHESIEIIHTSHRTLSIARAVRTPTVVPAASGPSDFTNNVVWVSLRT